MFSKTILFKFNKTNFRFFSTVDAKEIMKFKNFEDWWDPYGCVKPLHAMNKLRVPLVRDGLINTGVIKTENINTPHPLTDICILDIGCGAGIMSEPLARLGGIITGLDANSDIIEEARKHSKEQGLAINYEAGSIEDHSCDNVEKYHAIIASEIIEHVTQKDEFIKACVKSLKPTGSFFITTMSQTTIANIIGIQLTENILNIVPKGTHEIGKFIKPHDLQRILENHGCRTELIHGMVYNIFTNTWHWCSDTSINYALHAIKLIGK